MTDRELLELAAKAAGYEWRKDIAKKRSELGEIALWIVSPMKTAWNPLDDDGDALRLAVKMYMFDGSLFERFLAIRLEETRRNPARSDEEITRRAIVRVFAEIGKEMK